MFTPLKNISTRQFRPMPIIRKLNTTSSPTPPQTPTKSRYDPKSNPFQNREEIKPPSYYQMDANLIRLRLKCILRHIDFNMIEIASSIISFTIQSIKKYSIKDVGNYTNKILRMFNKSLILLYLDRIDDARTVLKQIGNETRMANKISIYFFMKHVDELPYDVKEHIINMM